VKPASSISLRCFTANMMFMEWGIMNLWRGFASPIAWKTWTWRYIS
jgi:hypothetical protein